MQRLLTSSSTPTPRILLADGQAKRLTIANILTAETIEQIALPAEPACVALSPRGNIAIVGSASRTYSVSFGENTHVASLSTSGSCAAAFSPDAAFLATGGETGRIRIYRVDTLDQISDCNNHYKAIRALCFSPSSTLLVSCGDDESVYAWSAPELIKLRKFIPFAKRVPDSVIFLTESTIAIGCYHVLRVMNIISGETVIGLTDYSEAIFTLAVSPDGSRLASGGDDKTVKIYDTATFNRQRLIKCENHVRQVCFIDNHIVLACVRDSEAILIDIESRTAIQKFAVNARPVCAAFFNDPCLSESQNDWSIPNSLFQWSTSLSTG